MTEDSIENRIPQLLWLVPENCLLQGFWLVC